MRSSALARIGVFGYLWGTLGFFAGTLVLTGPVRWVTGALRGRQAAQSTEDLLVRGVIVLLVVGTGWVAWRLTPRVLNRDGRRPRWQIPAATTALAAAALALWLNPRSSPIPESKERFVFGPYPSQAQLAELKRRGFAGVITLLHPAVVPFEPRLLAQERAAAAAVGMPLIETPMLPWVSENERSIERIRTLARAGDERYYVHCYLGKDRVNVVRRLLQDMNASVDAGQAASRARRIADVPAFERGSIYHLPDSVHVTPFPTDEEWMGFVLSGSVKQVLSLLDSTNREDTLWVGKERRLASKYRMPVQLSPIPALPFEPEAALRAAQLARSLPRPLVVHAFRTASAPTEAFVQAYRSGLPPLPPSLFLEPMEAGRARVIGVNVAAGPRPAPREFGAYLYARGVRGVVFVGPAGTGEARAGRSAAGAARIQWRTVPGAGPELDGIISRGGPWYLYGPGLSTVLPALEGRLDPGVPAN